MEIKDKIGVYPNVAVTPGTPAEEVKPAKFDTREQLEADVRGAVHGAYAYEDYIPEDMIIGWLDRQAAITERKFWEGYANGNQWEIHQFEKKCDELTAERDLWQKRYGQSQNEQAELRRENEELREAINAFELGQMYYLYQANNAVIEKWESEYKRLMEVVKTQAKSFGKIEFDRNMANGEIKRLEEKYQRLEEERDNLELRCRDLQDRLDEICKLVNE